METGIIQMQDIFKFQQEGYDASGSGKVIGRYVATGRVPEFYEEMRSRGLDVDMSLFK
jgi:pilus assembly protein CpaF